MGDQPEKTEGYDAQRGTRTLARITAESGTLVSHDIAPLVIDELEILVVANEIRSHIRYDLLPPALHPTMPTVVTWVIIKAHDSRVGPFCMAEMRVSCRAAMRPRAYVMRSVIDSDSAAAELAQGWGYAFERGGVDLHHGYAATAGRVDVNGSRIFEVSVGDPVLLHGNDPFWVADMVPAQTPDGLRLVQCEWDHVATQAERVVATVRWFDADAWTDPAVELSQPVSGLLASGSTRLAPARYVCDPHVPAQIGTQRLATSATG